MWNRMYLHARSHAWYPGMRVRLNVVAPIQPDAIPWRFIQDDRVCAPCKIGMRPSPWEKTHSYYDGRIPADRAADYKAGARWCKYDKRIIGGNVDVSRIDGQDFNIAAGIDDGTVRIRSQIAYLRACLRSRCTASITCGRWFRTAFPSCSVKLGSWAIMFRTDGNGSSAYVRVPLQIVGADCICQGIPLEIAVLVRPSRSLRNFLPECGCREYLY